MFILIDFDEREDYFIKSKKDLNKIIESKVELHDAETVMDYFGCNEMKLVECKTGKVLQPTLKKSVSIKYDGKDLDYKDHNYQLIFCNEYIEFPENYEDMENRIYRFVNDSEGSAFYSILDDIDIIDLTIKEKTTELFDITLEEKIIF